jgi:hypothetical protein
MLLVGEVVEACSGDNQRSLCHNMADPAPRRAGALKTRQGGHVYSKNPVASLLFFSGAAADIIQHVACFPRPRR